MSCVKGTVLGTGQRGREPNGPCSQGDYIPVYARNSVMKTKVYSW